MNTYLTDNNSSNQQQASALEGFAVRVETTGSLWAVNMLHKILYTIDTNWPYYVEAQKMTKKITVATAAKFTDIVGPTTENWDKTFLFYPFSVGGQMPIHIKKINEVAEWIGKNLPFNDSKFELVDVKFIPLRATDNTEWVFDIPEDLGQEPILKDSKAKLLALFGMGLYPADLNFYDSLEAEELWLDILRYDFDTTDLDTDEDGDDAKEWPKSLNENLTGVIGS